MIFDDWVREIATLCEPDRVHVCDGSEQEYRDLCQLLVQKGVFVPLKRPNSFWCHSSADDVARSEEDTYICSTNIEEAGPTNHWKDPGEMKKLLTDLFRGCMKGRTLYVIPFCMGPITSPFAIFGVQITDSPYVVCNMRLMTRMGNEVIPHMKTFIPCLHSVGVPLNGKPGPAWPTNRKKYIVHFPDDPSVWSFGSGYGGNALLSKKCVALRLASVLGKRNQWLAEHMLIIGLTNPQGEKKYITAAFPSSCGKTNLAMLLPPMPGWKVECIGDDIAWLHIGGDGRLYAINPEYGFFGVAPGTSPKTNRVAFEMIKKNTIFTNTALTEDHDVWWEGMEGPPPHLTSWEGKPWDPNTGSPASHRNARFTVQTKECSILSHHFDDPQGVPISAMIFGGRRSTLTPLVIESLSWNHGVLMGASVSSEMTAAAKGVLGKLRHDPFAMLPFCGYHMGDYFAHWIEMGKKLKSPPRIYSVNWFRKDGQGNYLWPGFRDNGYVLQWIFERVSGQESAELSPLGYLPKQGRFQPEELFKIDRDGYLKEVEELKNYFSTFGSKFPGSLIGELEGLKNRLLAKSR